MDNTVNLNYPQQQNNVAYQDQNSNAQAGLSNTMTGAADPSGPLFFGNYEAVKAIGKGKFAVVYRAHKIGDDEVVALKRISVDMMNDKAREKCLKEVRLLQSLDHPNIIRYMDSFITDNDLIIIYEWAAAGDLKRQIRKAQEKGVGFEERVVWKYFSQIANAIQHMHDRRIMHRDLKPANIFLTLDGTIKVGDLGLSREFSEHTHQAHSKVGTPLYMSPEVINGVDGYDFKSDIWSLGCLLYELAVLKSPFKSEGINIYTLLTKISNGEYTPIPDHYSEELRNLAHAMISTKPEDRPDIHYICDVAQKMRALTASDRSNRMKRSFSRSEDLGGDATSEIKGETNRGRAPSDFTTTATDRERESKDNDDYQNNNNNKNNNNNMNTNNNSNNNSNNNRSIESREKERDSARQGINHSSNSSGRGREVSSARDSKESERDWKDRREERGMWEDERKEREVEVVTPQTYRLPPRSNSSNPFQTNYNNNNNNNRNNTTNTSPPPSNSTSNTPSLSKKQLQYEDVVIPSDSSPVTSQKTSSSTTAVYRRSKPPRPDSASKNNNTNNNNGNNNSSNSSGSQRSRPVSGNVVDVDDVTSEPRSTSRPTSHYDNNHSNPSLADMGRQPSTSNLALMEGLENASAAFALMDAIYGKLTLLGYHMYEAGIDVTRLPSNQRGRGRLLPMHFAVNLRIFEKVAAHETSFQFQQFPRLVEVVTWLCCEKMAGSKAADVMRKVDLHNSNAVTVAKQMLLAAQAVGTLNDELSNVTPSSLLPGFGVAVCFLLSHFTDAALRATAFSPKPMVYATSSEDPTFDTGEAGEAEDESEAVEESSEGEGEGEGETVDVNSLENQHYLDGKEEDDESDLAFSLSTIDRVAAIENGGRVSARRRHGGIIESRGIDPLTWRQETERVTPSLKAAEKAWMTSGQTSWQSHVSLVQKYCQEISYSRNGRRADVTVPPPSSSAAASIVVESLTSVQGSLSSELAGIKKAERLLNARHDVLDHLSTYATLKTNLDNFLARSQSTQHVIDQLSSSLADKEELLQELQLSLQDRRGGNESDLNPVVRYKEAILRLQSEIREMFLSTNLISVQLMQCRQRQHNSRLEKMAKHRKRRARLRGKKLGKDDVISSEEEA